MRTHRSFLLPAAVLTLALTFAPARVIADHAGGAFKKLAEQLGLLVQNLPSEVVPGARYVFTVVSPDRLAGFGLTDLKANDQVEVTIIDDKQVSVTPVSKIDPKAARPALAQRLVVVADEKGAIARSQLFRGAAQQPMPARSGVAPRARPEGQLPEARPEGQLPEAAPEAGAVAPRR